ncbi:MAG: EFR1 family ferrodoxin [Paludibacteraceae bacterium]|nr:EFR1 family ferrodoxin [Paludibacteraceae bacterium]
MILYFSATGNSLAVARQLAERLNEQVMPLTEAVQQDLTNEKRIGLVFPTYDFNLPPAMPEMVARLHICPQSYVFTVVTCGSMVGNCIWVLRRILRKKGIELAYSHKVSVPDNSALAFGRNPNKQLGKFEYVPARMEQIIRELQAESHTLHYSWFSLLSWLLGRPAVTRGMIHCMGPKVNPAKCIGCGICAKVCPMENIRLQPQSGLTDKTYQVAKTGDHCTVCLACVHACPQQAFTTNGLQTRKERQYRHPQIHLKDLLLR